MHSSRSGPESLEDSSRMQSEVLLSLMNIHFLFHVLVRITCALVGDDEGGLNIPI